MIAVALTIYVLLYKLLGMSDGTKGFLPSALVYLLLMSLAVFYIFVFQPQSESSFDRVHSMALIVTFITTIPICFAFFFDLNQCIEFTDDQSGSMRSLYFSYLTFSTLGYGDGLPNDFCKPVAVLESILGLVSLAAMVSIALSWSKPS